MKVERTTFECEGVQEPCIIVSSDDGFCKVRISKLYHYLGPDTLCVREILDDEFNGEEEIKGDFDSLTDAEAIRIAKSCSAYIV